MDDNDKIDFTPCGIRNDNGLIDLFMIDSIGVKATTVSYNFEGQCSESLIWTFHYPFSSVTSCYRIIYYREDGEVSISRLVSLTGKVYLDVLNSFDFPERLEDLRKFYFDLKNFLNDNLEEI